MQQLFSKELSLIAMANLEGGSDKCVKGGTNGVITGFCLVGSFLNPFVAVGCAGYGLWQYVNCES
jgi:hypothetical protein